MAVAPYLPIDHRRYCGSKVMPPTFGGGGPAGLWQNIRPALIALDPKYKNDEMAFCAA